MDHVRRCFIIALAINSLSYSVRKYICVYYFSVNWSHSFKYLILFIHVFGCHLPHWVVVCPGVPLQMPLLPQPQQGQRQTLKPGGHEGTSWELSRWYQSTLLDSSDLVSVRPPSPGTLLTAEAHLKRQEESFAGSLMAHHVMKTFFCFYLFVHWCL